MNCSEFSDAHGGNCALRHFVYPLLPTKPDSLPSRDYYTEYLRQLSGYSAALSNHHLYASHINQQFATYNDLHDAYDTLEEPNDSKYSDDDASSIASILDAFSDIDATPPSTCWEKELEHPSSLDDSFYKAWKLRTPAKNVQHQTEPLQHHSNFDSSSAFPMSPDVDTGKKNTSVKKCSSAGQLSSTSPFHPSDSPILGLLKNAPNLPSHRSNKSWPVRTSSTASLPSLTHQQTNKNLIGSHQTSMAPKSRTSDMSTCPTLVSTSPVRVTFEKPSPITQELKALSHMDSYIEQPKTCEIKLPTPCNLQYSPECEKSSWDSDDDDDTIHNEGLAFYFASAWPRFGRPQMHVIKKKLRIGKPSANDNENQNQHKGGKWQEAVRKSAEGKKKMAHMLRGVLRLKNPSVD